MTGPTTRPTRQQLVERLGRELMDHTMAPGSRLPSERELAARFGISRPIVREVLREFQERGLVEIQPGRGAFVRRQSTLDAARVADGLYRRGQATPRHLVDARRALETRAASLAASEATPREVAAMERALRRFDDATGVLDRAQADLAFHSLVARASHNPVIELMFGSIARFVLQMMLRSLGDQRLARRGARDHRRVLDAIGRRDAETAERVMCDHVTLALSTYGEDLDEPLDSLARRTTEGLFDTAALDQVVAALHDLDE